MTCCSDRFIVRTGVNLPTGKRGSIDGCCRCGKFPLALMLAAQAMTAYSGSRNGLHVLVLRPL